MCRGEGWEVMFLLVVIVAEVLAGDYKSPLRKPLGHDGINSRKSVVEIVVHALCA